MDTERVYKKLEKYPNHIPMFLTKAPNQSDVSDIDRNKFLVPAEYTVGQIVAVIRKRIEVKPYQSIFVFIDNKLPPVSATIEELYFKYKDPTDGMLHVTYSGENAFGRHTVS